MKPPGFDFAAMPPAAQVKMKVSTPASANARTGNTTAEGA